MLSLSGSLCDGEILKIIIEYWKISFNTENIIKYWKISCEPVMRNMPIAYSPLYSLIRAFVVPFLKQFNVTGFYIANLRLVLKPMHAAEQVDLCLTWSEALETSFP